MEALRKFRPVTWLVIVTIFSLFVVHPAPAAAAPQAGAQLTVNGTGTVRIDGVAAATGATVFPGSRVTTASGVTATVTTGGSRLTINPDTDAIVTYAGGFIRADVVCGSASGNPAPGSLFEMITHGDTSVFVQTGTVQVLAEGKTTNLVANQTQTFNGGVKITTTGASNFEASTILCSCLCAAPAAFPPVVAAFPLALLLLLIGGGAAAAVAVPVVLSGDEGTVVVSSPFPG